MISYLSVVVENKQLPKHPAPVCAPGVRALPPKRHRGYNPQCIYRFLRAQVPHGPSRALLLDTLHRLPVAHGSDRSILELLGRRVLGFRPRPASLRRYVCDAIPQARQSGIILTNTAVPKTTVIFTVANLITTRVFPKETQGLAGAVFNTVAQFGASMGIAGMAVVNSATLKLHPGPSRPPLGHEEEVLMVGYRGVFWACTALMVVVCLVGGVGLRRCGRVQE